MTSKVALNAAPTTGSAGRPSSHAGLRTMSQVRNRARSHLLIRTDVQGVKDFVPGGIVLGPGSQLWHDPFQLAEVNLEHSLVEVTHGLQWAKPHQSLGS